MFPAGNVTLPIAHADAIIPHMGTPAHQTESSAIEAANQAVAAHLRAERARAALTQQQLADITELAVNTIRRLEAGQRVMTLSQLVVIAQAVGVSPGEFLDAAQVAYERTRRTE